MDIVGYVDSQTEDFGTIAFNAVDSLVLSQFTYLNLTDIVPGLEDFREPIRIGDLPAPEDAPDMLYNIQNPKENGKLLLALKKSTRFQDVRMCCYSNCLDIVEQKQFAAFTFLLDDDTVFIAYRGTDSTIIGWKEDFNMAFLSPIPAQEEGVSYLTAVAERLPHSLMVGGHSKGGNIAVYSSMKCHPAIQDRIVNIYSHDGPGFKDDIFSSEEYARIKTKVCKTVPQASLVGMFLQHQEDYVVVRSKQFWMLQHNPFSWVIDDGDFQYVQGITSGAEHVNKVINHWLSSIDVEERERFATAIYSIVESMGAVDFCDFSDDRLNRTIAAIETARNTDPETKQFIYETIKSLVSMVVRKPDQD